MRDYKQLVKQLKHEVQSGKLMMTEIEINLQSEGFSETIEKFLFNLLELYDPDVTLEQNLEDPDSVFLAMSGSFLKIMIEENIKPELENYRDKIPRHCDN